MRGWVYVRISMASGAPLDDMISDAGKFPLWISVGGVERRRKLSDNLFNFYENSFSIGSSPRRVKLRARRP